MAEAANIAYTTDQILDIALTVICSTQDFGRAQGDWENLEEIDKTWQRFKEHFKIYQKQLKAIRDHTNKQGIITQIT